jgi:hypothetical protein
MQKLSFSKFLGVVTAALKTEAGSQHNLSEAMVHNGASSTFKSYLAAWTL